jgi:hypothetical protein
MYVYVLNTTVYREYWLLMRDKFNCHNYQVCREAYDYDRQELEATLFQAICMSIQYYHHLSNVSDTLLNARSSGWLTRDYRNSRFAQMFSTRWSQVPDTIDYRLRLRLVAKAREL